MSQIATGFPAEPTLKLHRPLVASSSLDRIPVGTIVSAQVLGSLGKDAFEISIRGESVRASTTLPLAVGKSLALQVLRNGQGETVLRLWNATKPQWPAASQPATGEVTSALSRHNSDSILAQLLASRPDLVTRVEQLVRHFDARPASLGSGLSDLANEIRALVSEFREASSTPTSLDTLADRLQASTLGLDLLSDPRRLAETLANRFVHWQGGWERSIAKTILAYPSNLATANSSANPGIADPPLAVAKLPRIAPEATNVDEPSEARSVPLGKFDGDLKGQLLELRSRLTQFANTQFEPTQAATVQGTIERTETLLDQVTSQQIRNLEGLNRFVHVELPVDPRTGIEEARLQVYYRRRDRHAALEPNDDRFTVAIFLHLTHLGDVLATLTGAESGVSVALAASRNDAVAGLANWADELRQALIASGHEGATVSVRPLQTKAMANQTGGNIDEDLWPQFIEIEGSRPHNRLDRQA